MQLVHVERAVAFNLIAPGAATEVGPDLAILPSPSVWSFAFLCAADFFDRLRG